MSSTSTAIADGYDWRTATRVIDVGGGTGALISAILSANPHLTGVIFDRPAVAAGARRAIAARGLAARCEVVAGDFFTGVPQVEADVLILSRVVHDWDDPHVTTILRNIRATMRIADRLLLAEAILPPGDEPHPSKSTDVTMLLWGDGRERTLVEYRELLSTAGLRLSRVVSLPPNPLGFSLMEAVAANRIDQVRPGSVEHYLSTTPNPIVALGYHIDNI